MERHIRGRDGHPALHPTRIDIPAEIRLYLVAVLNQTLACTVDLRSQVKQAAWNVKGKEGFQLQTLFDIIAIELDAYAAPPAATPPRCTSSRDPRG